MTTDTLTDSHPIFGAGDPQLQRAFVGQIKRVLHHLARDFSGAAIKPNLLDRDDLIVQKSKAPEAGALGGRSVIWLVGILRQVVHGQDVSGRQSAAALCQFQAEHGVHGLDLSAGAHVVSRPLPAFQHSLFR